MKVRLLLFSVFITATTSLMPAAEPFTIHEAVRKNNAIAVKKFIDQDPSSVTHFDEFGLTALHWACIGSFENIVNLLVDHNASVDQPVAGNSIDEFYTNIKLLRLIVELCASHNAQQIERDNSSGLTPIGSIIRTLAILSKGGAKTANEKYYTPFMLTFTFGHGEIRDELEIVRKQFPKYDAARLAFAEVVHPRLGAHSPANVLPQYVVEEICNHLHPLDFAKTNDSKTQNHQNTRPTSPAIFSTHCTKITTITAVLVASLLGALRLYYRH